jgi:hypothetical protein
MTVIDTPGGIAAFRHLQLYYGLKMEVAGMRHSRGSVYALVKRTYGFKGNKANVFAQLDAHLREIGVLK